MSPSPNPSTRPPSALLFFLLALAVIALDQLTKWAVHTYMQPGMAGEIPVFGHWARLAYTLNPGMAFGLALPEPFGKLVLTGFRLLAVTGLVYYILYLVRHRAARGYIACMSLILGGAVGNVIDSIFYGVIYHNAPFGAPTPWFHGQVIDMIYVPIYEGYLPKSWPIVGGEYSAGFPVFNVADSCIFVGVALILISQGRFFKQAAGQVAVPSQIPTAS